MGEAFHECRIPVQPHPQMSASIRNIRSSLIVQPVQETDCLGYDRHLFGIGNSISLYIHVNVLQWLDTIEHRIECLKQHSHRMHPDEVSIKTGAPCPPLCDLLQRHG